MGERYSLFTQSTLQQRKIYPSSLHNPILDKKNTLDFSTISCIISVGAQLCIDFRVNTQILQSNLHAIRKIFPNLHWQSRFVNFSYKHNLPTKPFWFTYTHRPLALPKSLDETLTLTALILPTSEFHLDPPF